MDVVTAISQQNVQVAAGQIGQPPVPKGQQFQLTINTQGRLTDPEEFADIISRPAPGRGSSRARRLWPARLRRRTSERRRSAADASAAGPSARRHRHRPPAQTS